MSTLLVITLVLVCVAALVIGAKKLEGAGRRKYWAAVDKSESCIAEVMDHYRAKRLALKHVLPESELDHILNGMFRISVHEETKDRIVIDLCDVLDRLAAAYTRAKAQKKGNTDVA